MRQIKATLEEQQTAIAALKTAEQSIFAAVKTLEGKVTAPQLDAVNQIYHRLQIFRIRLEDSWFYAAE